VNGVHQEAIVLDAKEDIRHRFDEHQMVDLLLRQDVSWALTYCISAVEHKVLVTPNNLLAV
jgi:hypothetical protein